MVKLPHWPIPYGTQPAEQSPQRVERILQAMGNPQLLLPPVVHVAGTNGKGSTIAFLKSILQAAGYRVHSYTSPHLMRYNERICLAGKEITDHILMESIEAARIAAGDMRVTFFEGTTAAALYAFANTPADILLVEAGMGGRIDATNVFEKPIATVITPIAYDHMEYLGSTIIEIAWEKAGIMKGGSPCIIAPQPREVMEFLLQEAKMRGVQAVACGIDWGFKQEKNGFSFIDDEGEVDLPLPGLLGAHQIINASAALATLQCLTEFRCTYRNIIDGLRDVKWPARLQRVSRGVIANSLPSGWSIWVDGAHNPAGAEVLADSLSMWGDSKIILINGRTKGRDISAFLHPFLGKVHNILAVTVQSEPNPEDPNKIASVARDIGFDNSLSFGSVADAVKHCLQQERDDKLVILVAGSLYLFMDSLL